MNRFLNLNKMAFCTYGSNMTITRKQNAYMAFDMNETVPDGYYFHPLYDNEMFYGLLYRMSFEGIPSISMQYEFDPEALRLFYDRNSIRVCFPDRNTLRFAGYAECAFVLDYEKPRHRDVAFSIDPTHAELNFYTKKSVLYVRKGTAEVDAPWNWKDERCSHITIRLIPDENGELDFSIEEFDRGWEGPKDNESFDFYTRAQRKSFLDFQKGCMQTDNPVFMEAFEACAYMAWSSVIYDCGYIRDREVIVLSKNWMAMTASWDNTFNLLPFSATNQRLAMDQLFILFDYQEPIGALPDWITTQRYNHSFLKPPVVGAVMRILMDDGVVFEEKYLRRLCEQLEKLIEFWLNYRDYDHDGIPEYGHGNDSGNDNCTVFDIAPNVEAPDLTAYIVADYDFLARCERIFGNEARALEWEKKASELFAKLIEHSWSEERGQFVSPISGVHQIAEGDALINYMPIILAYRMDDDMKQKLVAGLKQENRFYTRWGFASESTKSPKYSRDSYWRGPIWAPQAFFVVEGLREAGETEFAREAAKRYVDLCMYSGCFAENYEALNGIGLRDTSYSWGSNVFQYFVHKYLAG